MCIRDRLYCNNIYTAFPSNMTLSAPGYRITLESDVYVPITYALSAGSIHASENLTLSGEKVFIHSETQSINAGAKVEGYVDNENGTFTIDGASAHCYHSLDYTG
jgi:hypothetical protein